MPGTWPEARARIVAHLTGVSIPATYEIAYDGEASGPFVVGETLTFSGGATATLTALDDDGSTGTLSVRLLTGSRPANDETITGGTSGATAAVNGTPSGTQPETLIAYERAPGGRQSAARFPYAFILPNGHTVGRIPNQRVQSRDVVVRVVLSGEGEHDMEDLHRRYDEWCDALMDAWDDAASLDGAADISVEQEFGGLALFADLDRAWGFDMTLPNVVISEVKTFSA